MSQEEKFEESDKIHVALAADERYRPGLEVTRPLVSFCLKAYNQRAYIGAALEGALAQTYRPLEIVISDDHSTDGTWELIQEKLKNFHCASTPPPTIVVHRNDCNLGNGKSWEMFGRLAHGELLIKADGDDISEPERTTKVVEAWVKGGKRAKVISSAHRVMDLDGHIIGEKYEAGLDTVSGAVQAWSRDCFAGWPEMSDDKAPDDEVWCVRARLLGGEEILLPDLLVRYRYGSGFSTGGRSYRKRMARVFHTVIAAYAVGRADCDWFVANGGDKTRAAAVRDFLEERLRKAKSWCQVTEGRWMGTRLKGACRLWRRHGFRGHVLTLLLALPFHLGDPIIERFRKKG